MLRITWRVIITLIVLITFPVWYLIGTIAYVGFASFGTMYDSIWGGDTCRKLHIAIFGQSDD